MQQPQQAVRQDPAYPIDITSLPDFSNRTQKGIPIEKLEALRAKGLSYKQIASIVGCSHVNVLMRLQSRSIDIDDVEVFKDNEGLILSQLRHRLISNITDTEIKKAPLATKMMAYGIAYDKYRLEMGLSTQNIDTHATQVNINQLSSELDKIRKRRLALQGNTE
jgi:hypothetical protein